MKSILRERLFFVTVMTHMKVTFVSSFYAISIILNLSD